MAGTKIGGQRAAATNLERYGKEFYTKIGRKGGSVQTPKGGFGPGRLCNCKTFDYEHNYASCAGVAGGIKSRRGPAIKGDTE